MAQIASNLQTADPPLSARLTWILSKLSAQIRLGFERYLLTKFKTLVLEPVKFLDWRKLVVLFDENSTLFSFSLPVLTFHFSKWSWKLVDRCLFCRKIVDRYLFCSRSLPIWRNSTQFSAVMPSDWVIVCKKEKQKIKKGRDSMRNLAELVLDQSFWEHYRVTEKDGFKMEKKNSNSKKRKLNFIQNYLNIRTLG